MAQGRKRRPGRVVETTWDEDGAKKEPEAQPAGEPTRVGPVRVGEAISEVFGGIVRLGWQNLLELVLLGLVWFVCMLTIGLALLAPGILKEGGGLLLAGLAILAPIAVVAPATVGLFAATDEIWAGAAIGPFDALRNFFRGFRRRYLRAVGAGALWAFVLIGAYANLIEDKQYVPEVLIIGVGILLLYLLLFFVMVNVYLIGILATTDENLLPAIRLAAWEAVANPMFTLVMLLVPAAVVLIGTALRPLLPMLAGGAIAFFCTAALRHVPLRHPDLPLPKVDYLPLEERGGRR